MTIEQATQDLLSVLEQTRTLLRDLLEGEDSKYEALRTLDIEKLIASNAKEEELLAYFDALERKRIDCAERFALLSGSASSASLSEMAENAGAHKESFLKVGGEIRALNERMSIAAERNRYILASNSEIIGSILDLMEGKSGQNYDNNGESSSDKHSLHMLDHTV